jgi:hypothetical protein
MAGQFPAKREVPEWALYLLCCEHISFEQTNSCPGCEGCETSREAAGAIFFELSEELCEALCELAFDLGVQPDKAFAWKLFDFAREVR